MKKQTDHEMLPEYDFAGGIRGKYVNRLAKGSNIVVLDKDVQKIFPNSVAVNAALRVLGKAVEAVQAGGEKTGRSTRARGKTLGSETLGSETLQKLWGQVYKRCNYAINFNPVVSGTTHRMIAICRN